ncbi:histone deacetylase 9-B isoform X2 [Scleropages formosus]|uniref:histone deacetylase n=1 Tax=Scleropages formosus TaxID=113540 RepID=A0A8C9QLY3_SCLFO|nr:histone deacetylase 9-B-like isoform X2 [Scleropages formosus]
MLQTIYEGEPRLPTDRLRSHQRFLASHSAHITDGSAELKPEVSAGLDPVSPLDLRTDRMLGSPTSDPDVWEKRLQDELILIQKQQQIQKQLLISEFQKQHENLIRQHQAQLQEHLKLQQELLAMRQHQELLEKERRLEQQSKEQEVEHHRREQQMLLLRSKERARKSAVASTEVKQKLQEFLLSKSAKDPGINGVSHSLAHHPKLWFTASHHTSLEQSSPPLGETSPSYKYTPPSSLDGKDDFPLRKTASEPNLKVRSRLKQKVAERRSSPLLRRKDSAPYKKRTLELIDSTSRSDTPGTGPSSPNGASSALGGENGPSSLPANTQTEYWPVHQRILKPEDSMTLLSLYTSPSLPNITLGLPSSSSPLSAGVVLKEKAGEGGGMGVCMARQALPAHFLGTVPLQSSMSSSSLDSKVSSSHQALLQHLLLKEQMRHHKILSGPGCISANPQHLGVSAKDRGAPGIRQKVPRHRPLHRTQSAPLPQGTLAQLVIQQQHQHFLEKQKQYQHQVHINKMLSKSIEQLRQPSANLPESAEKAEKEEEEEDAEEEEEEEEEDTKARAVWEDRAPPGGVIRNCRRNSGSGGSDGEIPPANPGAVKVKQETPESEDEGTAKRSTYLRQVEGKDFAQRLVIRAIN